MSILLSSYVAHVLDTAEEEDLDPAEALDPNLTDAFEILASLVASNHIEPRFPTLPTCVFPGSEAKILIMAAREARGEAIFHPSDCRIEDFDHIARIIHTGKNGREIQDDLAFKR